MGSVRGDTFQLTDGRTINGEVLAPSANDLGVQIKVGEGSYERVPWSSFSQDDLRKFQQDKKMGPLAEPFIEVTEEEKIQRTAVDIKPVPRLDRPESGSLLGAFFGSALGVLTLLLLYGANIYAGYEVSIFRAQPAALVCGVSAVLPLIGPIIFLAMPTRLQKSPEEEEEEQARAVAETPTFSVPVTPPPEAETGRTQSGRMQTGTPQAGGLRLSRSDASHGASAPVQTQVFQRGAFTFNRRFFETKFAGFFGIVRRDAEKDLVLVIKAGRGEYVCHRITRITANDMHVQVDKANANEEVTITFSEIKEVQLKHINA